MRAYVAVLFWIAACGGNQEAKPPQPDQTIQSDAAAPATTSESPLDASATNAQPDAEVAVAPEAGPADDVDKTVSVCGGEAIPIEKRLRKKVKECWVTAVTRNPALDGHVKVTFVVDAHGKVRKTEIAQKKTLGHEASACIMAAIHAYELDGSKCAGKSVGFEMAFGRAARD